MRVSEPQPSRRARTRGTAWVLPTLAVSAAAPALAVSQCRDTQLQPFPTSGSAGNGWAITTNGNAYQGATRFMSNWAQQGGS